MYCIRWVLMLLDCLLSNMPFKQEYTRLSLLPETLKSTNPSYSILVLDMTGVDRSLPLILIITNGHNGFSFSCSTTITTRSCKKPVPIEDLKLRFSQSGNKDVDGAHNHEHAFSSEEWNVLSVAEQDQVLMDYRLAYRKLTYVNWCEELGTVLANDEVKDGVSERGGFPVVRKPMLQWSLRITAYAERLLDDLQSLDWSHSLKTMQENWIGRSEGARVFFPIRDHDQQLEIFTTRPDTIFGATFMVIAPEHPTLQEICSQEQKEAVLAYAEKTKARSERERKSDTEHITGVYTGAHCVHPFTGDHIPIWVSEYVLMDYGTGAIMSVPSDDERDRKFAEHFNLPIIPVVDKSDFPEADIHDKVGTMINSGFINGMSVKEGIQAVIDRLEDEQKGWREINYKLRDANFSRQRYWGEPFPIRYTRDGETRQLNVDSLPLELPDLDIIGLSGDGRSPLAQAEDWVNLEDGSTRETDTMPGYAGSSWYFLRYMDAQNDQQFASQSALNYWQDVDLYVGGTEHAVGHLLYARFWHKFLFDLGYVPTPEPFRKLINQGMIQGVIEYVFLLKEKVDGHAKFLCSHLAEHRKIPSEDIARIPVHVDFVVDYGSKKSHLNVDSIKKFIDWRPEYRDAIFECSRGIYHKGVFTPSGDGSDSHLFTHSEIGKMSKRYFNVVNPDDVVDHYGADCFRMYEMFLGPIEHSKPWDTQGIDGVSKFLRRLWSLFYDEDGQLQINDNEPDKGEYKILHTCIRKVAEDIERFAFNTCVSSFMVCVNELKKAGCSKKKILDPLVRLIAPFAPHLGEELWELLGNGDSVTTSRFPQWDASYLVEEQVTYPIAVNGKKRGEATFPTDASVQQIQKDVLELEISKKWIADKPVRKVIVVPGRMVNIVV